MLALQVLVALLCHRLVASSRFNPTVESVDAFRTESIPKKSHPSNLISIDRYGGPSLKYVRGMVTKVGEEEDDEDDERDEHQDDEEDNKQEKEYKDIHWDDDLDSYTKSFTVNFLDGDFWDLFEELSCSCILESDRPFHDKRTWRLLRENYREIVGPAYSWIPLENQDQDGFEISYYIDHVEGKGRGVFAGEDIPKGTLIWTETHTAAFRYGRTFRKYLASLPRDLVCDVLIWSYVEEDEGETWLKVDLDPASFMNTINTPDEKNIGKNYVALRDISAGEELLVDYADFSLEERWEEFGM